VTVKK
jgi:hypothetical protein